MALKVVVDSPNLCFHTSSCILQEKSLAELAWTEKLASSLLTNGFQKDLHPGAESHDFGKISHGIFRLSFKKIKKSKVY